MSAQFEANIFGLSKRHHLLTRYFNFQRTPAPFSGVPINSMPIASKAFLSFLRVSMLPAGISSPADSNRTMVEKAISAFSAKDLTVDPVMARAALI
jgi:hypothetical protein